MTEQDEDRIARAAAVGKSLSHALRGEIIACFADERSEHSPSDIAAMLQVPLSNVSYHFNRLVTVGAVTMTRTAPRRGAVEHYYRLTALGVALRSVIENL